jgi:hypothetical protein
VNVAPPTDALSLAGQAAQAAHTAWVFVACAMVLLMTPGLAFFYGGRSYARRMP